MITTFITNEEQAIKFFEGIDDIDISIPMVESILDNLKDRLHLEIEDYPHLKNYSEYRLMLDINTGKGISFELSQEIGDIIDIITKEVRIEIESRGFNGPNLYNLWRTIGNIRMALHGAKNHLYVIDIIALANSFVDVINGILNLEDILACRVSAVYENPLSKYIK